MINKNSLFFKILLEFTSLSLALSVIYFASEAFDFKINSAEKNPISLFVFLLVGEISLVLPMTFAERYLSHLSDMRNQQFYQTLLGLKISPLRVILSKTIVDSLFPFLRIIFIMLFSVFTLKFNFTVYAFFVFMFLQLLAVLIFLLMALITSLFILRFNRGLGVFYHLQSVAAIFGGAYFPTNVFPSALKNATVFLPQTQVLLCSRLIFSGEKIPLDSLGILMIIVIVLLIIWIILDSALLSSLKAQARFF